MITTSDRMATYLSPNRTAATEARGQGDSVIADAAGTPDRVAASIVAAGAWKNVLVVETPKDDQAVRLAIASVLAGAKG